jgi:hypothetical protein
VQFARAPFNDRKAGSNPLRRELVVPAGATGYARFDILPPSQVLVIAARCQRGYDHH